jgi:hypothetical protein
MLRRCRHGTKRDKATCCNNASVITVKLDISVCETLDRAAYYIKTLPQRIAEVEAAAARAGRRAEPRSVKNLLSLPPLPRLESRKEQAACVAKVSYQLTEQVKSALEGRYKGLRLTKRAALDCALSEWLTGEMERSHERP